VRPVTVQESAPTLQEQVLPSGEEVTVYPVILESPSELGAVQVTAAEPVAAIALTSVGAPGGSGLGIEVTSIELGPFREAVIAWTENR